MPVDCIPARLLTRARQTPDAPGYFVRGPETWEPTTWAGYVAEVRRFAKALIAGGFSAGDHINVLAFNRPEWAIADHAAMLAGGAPAGIYTTSSAEEVAYIIGHSEAAVVVVENEAQWQKIASKRDQLPNLRTVVVMRGAPPIADPLVVPYDEFLTRGDGVSDAILDARLEAIRIDGVATLIYTSGTTGPPKAVMLTHENLAWTAGAAVKLGNLDHHHSTLSYLPLSHIAEQMFTLHGPASSGFAVYFARSMDKLLDDLKEVQPTILFGVPRVWEKMYAGMTARLATTTGVKKRLADWAQSVGRRVVALKNDGKPIPTGLNLQHRLADRLVANKVRQALGLSRAQFCVSGAAPIGTDVLEFMSGFGITIHEVYGQSEDSGPTTFNRPGRTRFGTVGPAVSGVAVEIGPDGEVRVAGPNVFAGYFKDEAATKEALDGPWLRSGDLGQFDADGYLQITGRKKDIIITAGGKNIAPKNLEAELKASDLIAEAIVIGDRQRFLVALLTLDDEAVARYRAANGLSAKAPDSTALTAALQQHIDSVNAKFAQVEHIRRWALLPRPLSIDAGELTPTLKIKRKVVEQHFADILAKLYATA